MHAVPRVPQISVSLAIEEPMAPEPYSPFSWTSSSPVEDDGFRPSHLSPPPSSTSPRFIRQRSPLNPSQVPSGQGIERERFEALLQASKERNAVGSKKGNDLRKEIALKAHSKKQVERRALFLSKVLAPPSPTSTLLPKTPPESPAIFNYTLPSPGLVSPLALFESLNENPAFGPLGYREPWVEQVDFRLPKKAPSVIPTTHARQAKPIPSLDQITARLSSKGHVRTPSAERKRLAAFIAQANVGRLQMPIRAPSPDMPPRSPCYPLSPKLQITTLVVPRTSSSSPTALSESNLLALNSREQRAKNMLSTIRKRTEHGLPSLDLDRKWKRRSAPAELSPRARSGFEHPVLAMVGGF
ncbi:hypothetical protein MIND_00459900 [Mycena indigotica]|uniref:Uncharacterized protein n=1 Tax=Mycena indigotica TaxID=2126181 RepID=A0A8H6SXM5_9AGAR|nr:uncharacterized protein MIND_00459900 [Mycena indigotica]KAF7306682.1 hypothetical protein MIND_00459900 [Mycena indigotica]